MAEFIYQLRAVRKAYGDKVVLDNVTLSFLPGAKIGVVGPNGTGKSSLLKIMAGMEQASNGEARLMPGFTVGILSQEPKLNEDKTVLGNVEEGVAETKKLVDAYNEIAEKLATDYSEELLEEMGKLQEQMDHRNAWDLDSQLEQAMDALRCPPGDAEVTTLSGGERRRVALCKLLLQQPDLLLLDEPTNHLDAESVLWLEQHLESYPGTVISITHDRYFLENVAQWILSSTVAAPSPTRATTPPTWRPRRPASRSRGRRTPSSASASTTSLSGSGPAPAPARRSRVPAWRGMRRWPPRRTRTASSTSRRSRSRPVPGWVTWSSRSATCPRASVTGCSSMT